MPVKAITASMLLSFSIVCCGLTLLVGCGGDAEGEAKTSHFEDDHEVAEHWPDDLADAALKLRTRLDVTEEESSQGQPLVEEIADIVSWVPELAADTNLSEQDWIPLDNAAQALSANLRATDNQLTDSNRQQTVALCERIEQSLPKIPAQRSSSKGSSP